MALNQAKVYGIKDLIGNGLDQLVRLTDSRTVTRGFKNHLKSIGIYKPAYVDFARIVWSDTVTFRYDPGMSNSAFKYLWKKQGKEIKDLKLLVKHEVKTISHFVDERTGTKRYPLKKHPGALRLLTRRQRGLPREIRPRRKTVEETGLGPVTVPPRYLAKVGLAKVKALDTFRAHGASLPKAWEYTRKGGIEKARKAGYLTFDGLGLVKTYLGGQSTPVPLAHHKKYWYFLRKRHFWRFSEHHPYGDEFRYFKYNDPG